MLDDTTLRHAIEVTALLVANLLTVRLGAWWRLRQLRQRWSL